jgi:acetyl esterase/lipase
VNASFKDDLLKTRVFWLGFLLSLAVTACAGAPAPTPTPNQPPPTAAPTATPGAPGIPRTRIPFLPSGTWQRDVTFCQDGDAALKMDVMYPDAASGAVAPVVVFLHELGGSKDGVDIDAAGELLKRGYVVAAPNWRQPRDAILPIGFGDAKCAIRHLRANAEVYHIDPNRIGALGCSVGGTIAALLGLTNAGAGLEGSSGYGDQSSRVEAVAARDIVFLSSLAWNEADLKSYLGVSSADDPVFAKINPITYVSKDAPPFLILQTAQDRGEADVELYDKLKAAGVPLTYVEITGSDHCENRGTPSQEERAVMIADFFDQSLK